MSDQTPNTSTTTNAPQKPRKTGQKARSQSKGYRVPDLARAYLAARGVKAPSDARIDKTCKTVRGFIRANKSKLGKSDPAIKRHTKGADYGVLNARTRDAVVKFAKGQYKTD